MPNLPDRVDYLTGRAAYGGLRRIVKHLNRVWSSWVTFHERPKSADAIGLKPEPEMAIDKAAIVMQGPIMNEDQATLETCKLYRRYYPSAHIILSTWLDTPEEELAPFRAAGVDVIKSEKPADPRPFNLNMQLVTARAGVRRAIERGAEWILKTRTDQRLYYENALGYLALLCRTFPPGGSTPQRHRIIGVGQGSLRYIPYHLTDQTLFGHAEDMKRYWDIPVREGRVPEHMPQTSDEIFQKAVIQDNIKNTAAETYFASEFLKSLGRELPWTVEDSWAAYRDHFCFADYKSTGFFWIKGQVFSSLEWPYQYERVSTRQEIGFAEWFMLYTGQIPPEAGKRYEWVLKMRFWDAERQAST